MRKNFSSKAGAIWLPWLVIILMLVSLVAVYVSVMKILEEKRGCTANLRQAYLALELYEMDKGQLPNLHFFPEDVFNGDGSIRKAIEEYGVQGSSFICPAASDRLSEEGLTYIWNVRLNGSSFHGHEEPQWVLMDIHAMHEKVHGPHFGRVHILYSDGSIALRQHIPAGVRADLE